MAKDKDKNTGNEGAGNESASSYALTETAMRQGYKGTIDGRHFVIDFTRSFDGKRVSQFASVCKLTQTPAGNIYAPQQPEVYELSGLTPLQVHELGVAQVISFTKEQGEAYKEWCINRFK